MKRIIIIGSPGSGKSTLSFKLKEKLGIDIIHLDKIFWRDNWTNISREEFKELLEIELQKEKWIAEGNYSDSIPLRLKYVDTVIFLDFKTITCLARVIKRVFKYYGKTRPEMGENCPERFDFVFIKYVLNFNKNNREKLYKLLDESQNLKLIVLKNRKEVEVFLNNL